MTKQCKTNPKHKHPPLHPSHVFSCSVDRFPGLFARACRCVCLRVRRAPARVLLTVVLPRPCVMCSETRIGTHEAEVESPGRPRSPHLRGPFPVPRSGLQFCFLSLKGARLPKLSLCFTEPDSTPTLCPLKR